MSFWDALDPKIPADPVRHLGRRPRRREPLSRSGGAAAAVARAGPLRRADHQRAADRRSGRAQLARIGLPRECWDYVATSGEAGIEALNALGKPVGFVGTAGDREILEGRGVRDQRRRRLHRSRLHRSSRKPGPQVEDYPSDLERWADARRAHALPQPRPAGRSAAAFPRPAPVRSPTSTKCSADA